MLIQVNTDTNIQGTEKLGEYVRSVVEGAVGHYSDQISRLEVHLGDENAKKSGQEDKRCMIEVRIEGRSPTAVTHHASTLEEAVDGAAEKLKHSLASTLERLHEHRG